MGSKHQIRKFGMQYETDVMLAFLDSLVEDGSIIVSVTVYNSMYIVIWRKP